MSDTALQRLMRATDRKITECDCEQCRKQCRTPCLGTPEDILRLVNAGYKHKLTVAEWHFGVVAGIIDSPILMVQPLRTVGGCAFLHDGLCELHDIGLKPTEGKLSHHSITSSNFEASRSISWNVAKEWLRVDNLPAIFRVFQEFRK